MQLVFLKTNLLEMSRLISFVFTLTETRIGVGMVTFPSNGPMWGQNIFFMAKSQRFHMFYIFN